jgi:aspartate 4-decarboxylase
MSTDQPSSFELQTSIVAAAHASGHPVLDAGRGQPNWIATVPRSAFFELGNFAVAEATSAGPNELWGGTPPQEGLADRLLQWSAASASDGARFLPAAVEFGVGEFGFDADAWVGELVRGILGAGYPSPNRMLRHIELVMERYVVEVTGAGALPAGSLDVFGTEGGAAAMAYVFRTLQENQIVGPGDTIAIATPIFTPYLQIPVLEDFGFEVVEIHASHNSSRRFDDGVLDQLLDPRIKVFVVVNPGNPDSRAIHPERVHQLRTLVSEHRPDLIIVADTVYASFVEGFRGLLAELPRHTICLHSFSKNFGATGNRLGFIAMHRDHVVDDILAAQPDHVREQLDRRYRSMTSDASTLSFMSRLVADSREVALHNIAGLATPDQVQMALFALAYLLPSGHAYFDGTRTELAARLAALLEPLGIPAPGGQDSMYYALIDLLQVVEARHGTETASWLRSSVDPVEASRRLARDHGMIVLPGQLFDAESWDVRVSLASLTTADLTGLGRRMVEVLDELVAER